MVFDLARNSAQGIVANPGTNLDCLVAEPGRFIARQTPTTAESIDDLAHGRRDGVANLIAAGRRCADRGALASPSPDSLKLVLNGA